MSRKLTILAVILTATMSGTAFGGGPDVAAPAPSVQGLYLEGGVGYAWRNWENMTYWQTYEKYYISSFKDRSTGGFSAILDLGYQFNEYFSVEAGWIYLAGPTMNNGAGSEGGWSSSNISTWTLYFGGKLQAPIYSDTTFIYGKLAAAYNYNQVSAISSPVRKANYWSPLFAAGVQHYLTPNISAHIQYTFIPSYSDATAVGIYETTMNVPASNILTVGIGYKFMM